MIFLSARELYGLDAAWASLAAATVCEPTIYFARQARYYSAVLALTACCCFLICLILKRGKGRHYLLGALVFVLLFHTHPVAFFSVFLLFALTIPWQLRHQRGAGKLLVFNTILVAGILPWIVLTGFFQSISQMPMAWSLLMPRDLWALFKMLAPFPWIAILALGWLTAVRVWGSKLPSRVVTPFTDPGWGFIFLAAWALIVLVVFTFLVPAASFFYGRVVLLILPPGLLFGSLLFAALARMIRARRSSVLALCLFILPLVLAGQATFWKRRDVSGAASLFDVIESLRQFDLRPGTRLYATPNDHLRLTFYMGIPIQSVAPVRKSFLDHYAGELVILEAGPRYEQLDWEEIQRGLAATGHPITETEARKIQALFATSLLREELKCRAANVTPRLQPVPDYFTTLFIQQRQKTAEAVAE
jgi:hypothetical protein